MDLRLLFAIATLSGTIIGAGIFGVPYVISQVGFLAGLIYLLILTGVILSLHLIFGEIILRTKELYRLPGYAKKYLGQTGKTLVSISTFIGIPFALILYTITGGEFLSVIFDKPFFTGAILLWLTFSIGIIIGIKMISRIELFTLFLFTVIIGLIFFISLPQVNFENFAGFYSEHLFLPYGVILFALAGTAAIPTIREILKDREKDFKKAIILGTLIPAFFYVIFSFSVIGVSGNEISEEAISGLVGKLGNSIIFLGVILGLAAILTSFFALGIYLRDVLILDFKVEKPLAIILVITIPLVGITLGKEYLIILMGFVGAILGAFEDIILLLVARKAETQGNRRPEWDFDIPDTLVWVLCLMFAIGLIYEISSFFQ